MIEEFDDLLESLLDGEFPEPPRLEAVVSAREYSVAIPEEDAAIIKEKDKWDHLQGVLHRRGCNRVQVEDYTMIFWLCATGATIEEVMAALTEELDDITGRKMEEAGAEAWGMF